MYARKVIANGLLHLVEVRIGFKFECQRGHLVGIIAHQLTHKVDVGDDILPVDVLLDEEVGHGIGITDIKSFVGGVPDSSGASLGDMYCCRHGGRNRHCKVMEDLSTNNEGLGL